MAELFYPSELIRKVGEELQAVAPTGFGPPDQGRHSDARRYTWLPIDGAFRGPRKNGQVDGCDLRFSVECWGGSFDDAWWMVCALLNAIQRAWGGRNYEALGLRPTSESVTSRGFVWTVDLAIRLHIPATDLQSPPVFPGQRSTTNPSAPAPSPPTYQPTGETTAQINSVAQATPATSTPGDGVLESEET